MICVTKLETGITNIGTVKKRTRKERQQRNQYRTYPVPFEFESSSRQATTDAFHSYYSVKPVHCNIELNLCQRTISCCYNLLLAQQCYSFTRTESLALYPYLRFSSSLTYTSLSNHLLLIESNMPPQERIYTLHLEQKERKILYSGSYYRASTLKPVLDDLIPAELYGYPPEHQNQLTSWNSRQCLKDRRACLTHP